MKKHYKYPDISRLGHDDNRDIFLFGDDTLVVEEKVDGGNGMFWLDEESGIIYEGSRNRNLIEDEDEKAFIGQRLFLREKLKDKKLNPDYVYFIEWMQRHTVKYTNAPDVIGLDIRPKHSMDGEECGLFIGREVREQEFDRLGIENVPLVWKGTAKELKEMEISKLIPQSKYYDGFAEGIVIKNYCRKARDGNHQLYAKVVREEFKECNKAVFGAVRDKNNDTNKIVDEFATEARIQKIILKLINEDGHKLETALMKYLPTTVIKDILKEEFEGLFEKYKFIDFSQMKKIVAKMCLHHIYIMMEEKAKA